MSDNRLIEETLKTSEVLELYKMAQRAELVILRGIYTSWTGDKFYGWVINSVNPQNYSEYYFMEESIGELQFVDTDTYTRHYKKVFSRLMRLNSPAEFKKYKNMQPKNLAEQILKNAYKNLEWDYIHTAARPGESSVIPMTYGDIYNEVVIPMNTSEIKAIKEEKEQKRKDLIKKFSSSNLPEAENDLWYSLLDMEYSDRNKLFNTIRNMGNSIRICGERDSFGWVTKGIELNGELMCIY